MSEAQPLAVNPSPDAALSGAALEIWERAPDRDRSWPVTRLASWSLTLLLLGSVLGPVTVRQVGEPAWFWLLVPASLIALCTRGLFELLDFGVQPRGLASHALAAIPPALLAAASMAGASAVVGAAWSPLMGASTAVMSALTLVAAGTRRGIEIRLRIALRRVYLIGSAESQRDLERELARHHDARLVGATAVTGDELAIDSQRLIGAVLAADATTLVLDSSTLRIAWLQEAAAQLSVSGVHIRDLVSYYEQEFKKVPLAELSPVWFLPDTARSGRGIWSGALRRAVEAAFAATLLLLVTPGLILAAVAIRLTSPGPALYRQRRVGQGGTAFTLWKLRTMTLSPEAEAAWAPSQAHRVTRIGRHLRRFRVDELPQLWNVLRGDLALIGPRPEQVPIVERLERTLPYYSARHSIRPGLTGWAQVNLGYGGSIEGATAKLQRDLYYVKRSSARLDALIIWLTLKAVLAGRG